MTLPYRLAVGAVRVASPLLSIGDSKLARGIAGRREAHRLLAAWGHGVRDEARPVVWLHAPSVGEGLQARAVLRELLGLRDDLQVVFTYFSPSAEDFARDMGADVATYVPWDLRTTVGEALDAVRPDLLVFTKTEVWPVLVEEADRRSVPVAIVGATVPDGAGRLRWPARVLLGPTWRRLSVACAIDEADRERLVALGVPSERAVVTGDPGIDSAAARFGSVDPDAPYLRPLLADRRPTVVAGSTWPADEAVLVPALAQVRRRLGALRVVVAPHEPDEGHIGPLAEALRGDGWTTRRLGGVERAGSVEGVDAVIVDRVGVLAHLYAAANVSYVGGGFHGAGLHSVLEPAAAGSPILIGPRHANSRAAHDLVARGGAKIAASSAEMADVLSTWLLDPAQRNRAGEIAAQYIGSHRGAAARCAARLRILLPNRE